METSIVMVRNVRLQTLRPARFKVGTVEKAPRLYLREPIYASLVDWITAYRRLGGHREPRGLPPGSRRVKTRRPGGGRTARRSYDVEATGLS